MFIRLLTQDNRALAQKAEAHFAKAKAKAGFVDCLNVELARFHGQEPLATFDRAAARLPGATLL